MVRRALSPVELLIVVAILAVLLPAFSQAQARREAPAASNLRQIGAAALQYLNDHDGEIVMAQPGARDGECLWPTSLLPYVETRAVFFDPTRPVPEEETVRVAPSNYQPWFRVVSLSINEFGYSGFWDTLDDCWGRRVVCHYARSMAAMREPERRVAFAPTTWGGTKVGWYAFQAYDASWIGQDAKNAGFSRKDQGWNTRGLYGGTIPVVHADGSLGRLQRSDFVDGREAKDVDAYCRWMERRGKSVWGRFWNES